MSEFEKISVKTVYLRQDAPFIRLFCRDIPDVQILKQTGISTQFYLYLFARIGGVWGWTGRYLLSNNQLQKKLDENHIFVVFHKSVPIGFAELEIFGGTIAEIAYFGIESEFSGKGFGKLLMQTLFDFCSRYNQKIIHLHTCEFDHPNALKFYQTCGFEIYKDQIDLEFYPTDFIEKKRKLT